MRLPYSGQTSPGKPCRVVIDLTIPELEKKESEERKQVKTNIKDKVIIIDSGHGGEDPGAIGRNQTKEKDVVLKIVKRRRVISTASKDTGPS